jgi:hypothetical protein
MEAAHPKGGNRRSPGEHQRAKTMTVKFTDGELAAVRAAAERTGIRSRPTAVIPQSAEADPRGHRIDHVVRRG